LEIRPTKLIKGQGLAKLLAEANCKSLGVGFINECSKNQQDQLSDANPQVEPPLARRPWYKDVIYFLQELWPPYGLQRNKARALKLKAVRYRLVNQVLYWKDPLGVLFKCMNPQEADRVNVEFHSILCGGHHFWNTTAYKILRAGYYQPTLFTNVYRKVRACIKCQRFSGKQQIKSLPLKPVVVSGPFQQWGLDFIGEIHPASSGQHRWILTATDLFTKWIESIPTGSASHKVIIGFLEGLIKRFSCPNKIFTDNATSFKAEPLAKFCEQFGIKLIHSTPYYPKGNGLVESSNKSLIRIIKILLEDNKKAWDSKLKFALWADQVTTKRSTGISLSN
jgi:hypothetical protein